MCTKTFRTSCLAAAACVVFLTGGCGGCKQNSAVPAHPKGAGSESDEFSAAEGQYTAPSTAVQRPPGNGFAGGEAGSQTGKPAPNGLGGKKKMAGGGGYGSQRPSPKLSADEQAVQDMLDRVGGTQVRLTGTATGPGAFGGQIKLPGDKATDADLELLKRLNSLFSIEIQGPNLGDSSIPHLLELPKLATIHLKGKSFTDKGIPLLAAHRALCILTLEDVAIGTAGLAGLSTSAKLQYVDLVDVKITPDILEGLKQLRKVREIKLVNCDIADTDVAKLKELLPECDILVEQDGAKD